MSETTTRDAAWFGALKALTQRDEVDPDDVLAAAEMADENRRTAKRVLRALTELGLAEKPSRRAHSWARGEQFDEVLGVESRLVDDLEIVAGVLEVVDRRRESREIHPEDVLDEIVEEYPPEYDEDDVEPVLDLMARAGLLERRGRGIGTTSYYSTEVEPSECEWCGAPFPEAIRYDVTGYDEQGRPQEEVSICSTCLSEKY